MKRIGLLIVLLSLLALACGSTAPVAAPAPQIIVVTATPQPTARPTIESRLTLYEWATLVDPVAQHFADIGNDGASISTLSQARVHGLRWLNTARSDYAIMLAAKPPLEAQQAHDLLTQAVGLMTQALEITSTATGDSDLETAIDLVDAANNAVIAATAAMPTGE